MSACPKCQTSYSGGARICRNCGGALEAAKPEAAPGVEVVPRSVGIRTCSRCGRCVPPTRERCVVCTGTSTQVVPAREDGASWVRISADYQCGGCSRWVPFRAFAEDGQSVCSACDHRQQHAIIFWRVLLKHAQSVVSLDDAIEAEHVRDDDDLPRELVAVAGHPRCIGCSTPIAPTWPRETTCPSCAQPTLAARPPIAARLNRSLIAILPEATSPTPKAGAVALRCPTCDGPLTITEGATTATCKYCQASSLVVHPTAPRRELRAPAACWLLFAKP